MVYHRCSCWPQQLLGKSILHLPIYCSKGLRVTLKGRTGRAAKSHSLARLVVSILPNVVSIWQQTWCARALLCFRRNHGG